MNDVPPATIGHVRVRPVARRARLVGDDRCRSRRGTRWERDLRTRRSRPGPGSRRRARTWSRRPGSSPTRPGAPRRPATGRARSAPTSNRRRRCSRRRARSRRSRGRRPRATIADDAEARRAHRARCDGASAEPPGDVVERSLVVRLEEHLLGRALLRRRRRARSRPRGRTRSTATRARPAACCASRSRSSRLRAARRSSPRCGGSRSGRARSTARPSAGCRAAPRAPARCTAAAAGRPRARRPPHRAGSSPRSTGRPARGSCWTISRAWPRESRVPPSLRPATTFSATVIAGNGFGFWNTMPMRRRMSVMSSSER